MDQPRQTLTPTDVWADPDADWQGLNELIATTPLENFAPVQRPVALAFYYSGEVGNGGHLQYFLNRGTQNVAETARSLRLLGGEPFARILDDAHAKWIADARLAPADIEEFMSMCQEREFDDLDEAFYALDSAPHQDRIDDLLRRYLSRYKDEFLVYGPATSENDRMLLALGDPASKPGGGRSAWLALLHNESVMVRLRAAGALVATDREIAIEALQAICDGPYRRVSIQAYIDLSVLRRDQPTPGTPLD